MMPKQTKTSLYVCANPRCPSRHKSFQNYRAFAQHINKSVSCTRFLCNISGEKHPKKQNNAIINKFSTQTELPICDETITNFDDDNTIMHIKGADEQENVVSENILFTIDHKFTIMLLKILDDINAPDYAFEQIFKWAQQAYAETFNFIPTAGFSRQNNITFFRKMFLNHDALLPQIKSVMLPHGASSEVVTFDFVPQLLSLLQNQTLMTPENLAIDFLDPLKPYKSPTKCLDEALSGTVYQSAYKKYVIDSSKDFFVPIIQWIDRTQTTGNDRYSLKPYMFSPAIFKEKCRRQIKFWGYHGFLPKRKDTMAINQKRRMGDNIRNYHAELSVVLNSFSTSTVRLQNVWLPIGPSGSMQVNIICCILYIIQDMQEGDMLCGRFGPHIERIQRQCRACDINFGELSNPNVNCQWLYAKPMHAIAVSGDTKLQQRWSQHQLYNAFINMPFADPKRGIFGATPVDTMHCFRKGLIETFSVIIIDNLTISQKARLDTLVMNFHKRHNQTVKSSYPIMNFSRGVTGLSKLSASERVGIIFLLVMLANLDEGEAVFKAAFEQDGVRTVRHVIEILEALLTFDAWLNQDQYWKLKCHSNAMHNAQESIRMLLKLCVKRFPDHKWEVPKFHEMLHVVEDMHRFGASKNFSAQRPESLLITAAKRPGKRAPKCQNGALYDFKSAQRVVDSIHINKCFELIMTSSDNLFDNINKIVENNEIINGTGKATFGQVSKNEKHMINVSWRTKSNQEHMQLPGELLHFIHDRFGDQVIICTEFRRDKYVFRCHPNFYSNSPRFDWLRIQFDSGIFPCRLCSVVLLFSSTNNDPEYFLIVQSTTAQSSPKYGHGSVLFNEWLWSHDYFIVPPESIHSPCFVISSTDDSNRILEALPYEDWALQFTNMEQGY